jgi:hypothetical protein
MPRLCSSDRKPQRSCSERPRRSTDQAIKTTLAANWAQAERFRAPFLDRPELGTIFPAASFPHLGDTRMDANSGESWSEMDIQDLRASLDFGNTIADAAIMLCREQDEVRQKMKELGLVERRKIWCLIHRPTPDDEHWTRVVLDYLALLACFSRLRRARPKSLRRLLPAPAHRRCIGNMILPVGARHLIGARRECSPL